MIGEKGFWGQGIGTETIRLLTQFGFTEQSADALFGCFVAGNNPRSYRAFQRVGYQIVETIECEPGKKSSLEYTLRLTRKADLAEVRCARCTAKEPSPTPPGTGA